MGKSDRQPKPYACDRFLSIQAAQNSLWLGVLTPTKPTVLMVYVE